MLFEHMKPRVAMDGDGGSGGGSGGGGHPGQGTGAGYGPSGRTGGHIGGRAGGRDDGPLQQATPGPTTAELEAQREAEEEARRRAQSLDAELRRRYAREQLEKAFGSFNGDWYGQQREGYLGAAMPSLDDQYGIAKDQLTYALARGGAGDTTRDARMNQLQADYEAAKNTLSTQADEWVSGLRGDIGGARAEWFGKLDSPGSLVSFDKPSSGASYGSGDGQSPSGFYQDYSSVKGDLNSNVADLVSGFQQTQVPDIEVGGLLKPGDYSQGLLQGPDDVAAAGAGRYYDRYAANQGLGGTSGGKSTAAGRARVIGT